MKIKLNFSGIIILGITFLVICCMFYSPYKLTSSSFNVNSLTEYNLLGVIGKYWIFDVFTIPFWWPIFLILELSTIKQLEKVHIWIFLTQALIMIIFTFFVILFINFHFLSIVKLFYFNYYFIHFFVLFGVFSNGIIVWLIGREDSNKLESFLKIISIFKR